ncbi:hypothetical protein C7434_4343 [Pantoea sp. PNA 14-12]|nr:hypothetical protein C7434_4343 [Pantoea sp. PNA 14-12]
MKKLAFIFNQPVFGNLLSFVQGSGFNYKKLLRIFSELHIDVHSHESRNIPDPINEQHTFSTTGNTHTISY